MICESVKRKGSCVVRVTLHSRTVWSSLPVTRLSLSAKMAQLQNAASTTCTTYDADLDVVWVRIGTKVPSDRRSPSALPSDFLVHESATILFGAVGTSVQKARRQGERQLCPHLDQRQRYGQNFRGLKATFGQSIHKKFCRLTSKSLVTLF